MTTPRPATYSYKTERHVLDNDAGQRAVYEALLDAEHLAKANGLIPHDQLACKISLGDSFGPLAVIDRLIETGYLARADNGAPGVGRQLWIYRWIARSRS
jgi:hypothetical protein